MLHSFWWCIVDGLKESKFNKGMMCLRDCGYYRIFPATLLIVQYHWLINSIQKLWIGPDHLWLHSSSGTHNI